MAPHSRRQPWKGNGSLAATVLLFLWAGVPNSCLEAQQTSGNLVQNGSFELPGGNLPTVTVPPANPFIQGWSVTRGTIVYVLGYFACSNGRACVDLNGTTGPAGGIAQSIATEPGASYTLTFDLAGNPDGAPRVKNIRVLVAGRSFDYSFDTTGKTRANMGWQTMSVNFTASGATTALEFHSLNPPGYWGPVIDNVRVSLAAPPPVCTYALSPAAASIPAGGGSGAVTVTAGPGCAWAASVDVSWISVESGDSGSGSGAVRYLVAANRATVARTGVLRIAGQTHTVTQSAGGAPPDIAPGGIVNSADNSTAFAPGVLVAINGTGLAAAKQVAGDLPLPLTLADQARVEVLDGDRTLAAPLSSVSPAQILAQLPFDIAGSSVQIRVVNSVGASGLVTIPVAAHAPRVLTRNIPASGEAAAFHTDKTPVSAEAPATPGESLYCYASGLGATAPPAQAGAGGGDDDAAGPVNVVAGSVRVLVDGQPAQLLSASLAPGLAGVYQVGFVMPWIAGGESVTLEIAVDQQRSPPHATLAYNSSWESLGGGEMSPAGGTIEAGGLTLLFAPDALAAPAEVSVYRIPAGGDQQPAAVASDLYSVKGLPPGTAITLSFDLTRPAGDLECWVWARTLGPWQPGLRWYQARVEGGRAIVDLAPEPRPPDSAALRDVALPRAAAPAAGPATVQYRAIYRPFPPTYISSDGKFHVEYSDWTAAGSEPNGAAYLNAARMIAEVLPEARDKIEGLGLSWERRSSWPFYAYVYDFRGAWDSLTNSPDEWGVLNHSQISENWYTLSLNLAKLAPEPELAAQHIAKIRQVVGHELFHMMQVLYDARGNSGAADGPATWYWFHEAASTWFERRMTDDKTFIPDTVRPLEFVQDQSDNYAAFIKQGLEFHSSSAFRVQNHGYGASMFLEHLSRIHGDSIVGDIFKLKKVVGPLGIPEYQPVRAISEVLRGRGTTIGEEWRAFCRNLMSGTVYEGTAFPTPSLIVGSLRSGAANESYRVRFTADSSPTATFSWSSPDLSARLYLVNIDYQMADNAKLVLKLTDSVQGESEVILYRVGAEGLWEPLGSVLPGVAMEIPDAGSRFRPGQAIAMLMANGNGTYTFTQRGDLKLTVSVEIPVDPALAALRGLRAEFTGDHVCTRSPGTSSTCYTSAFKIDTAVDPNVNRYELQPVQLKWSGTSFEVQDTVRINALEYTFNIRGELDARTLNLVRATLEMTKAGGGGDKEVSKYTLTNLQLQRLPSGQVYTLSGPEVKDHISDISYQYSNPAAALTVEYSGTNWNASQRPYVALQLVK